MKARQIGFQLLLRLYKPRYRDIVCTNNPSTELPWPQQWVQTGGVVDDAGLSFNYLNQKVSFLEGVDWNYSEKGKLWTYNLNYFEYLSNPRLSDEVKIASMQDYFSKRHSIEDGMEPYPTSLRNMNWIKFCSSKGVREFDEFIYSQAVLLSKSFEYHLMGNHLLENAFSLLFAAHYFKDITFYKLASRVLREQLKEQILFDGAHFERSPMYHRILLSRLLDLIFIMQETDWKNDQNDELCSYAGKMLSWSENLTFSSGISPHFYDSQENTAATTSQLRLFANRLNIPNDPVLALTESGYRMFKMGHYECIVNIAGIISDYIPGHAHADIFHFEFEYKGEPLFVDTGVSSYEDNQYRRFERSTSAHNTVEVGGRDQSEMWGAFRVAKRAALMNSTEGTDHLMGEHEGYMKQFGLIHRRRFNFSESEITITDDLIGAHKQQGTARLHLPPGKKADVEGKTIYIGDVTVTCEGGIPEIQNYNYAQGFNDRVEAHLICIPFQKTLVTRIQI
jgi:hypothetical protein